MTRREFGVTMSTFRPGILMSQNAAVQSHSARPEAAIDQNTIRRRGVGLRGLDAARASTGLTLFTPMMGDGAEYLIDLKGKIVHAWRMPYPPGMYGYLTENGTLFYNGKIPNDTFLGRTPFQGAWRWRQIGTGGFFGRCATRITTTTGAC